MSLGSFLNPFKQVQQSLHPKEAFAASLNPFGPDPGKNTGVVPPGTGSGFDQIRQAGQRSPPNTSMAGSPYPVWGGGGNWNGDFTDRGPRTLGEAFGPNGSMSQNPGEGMGPRQLGGMANNHPQFMQFWQQFIARHPQFLENHPQFYENHPRIDAYMNQEGGPPPLPEGGSPWQPRPPMNWGSGIGGPGVGSPTPPGTQSLGAPAWSPPTARPVPIVRR